MVRTSLTVDGNGLRLLKAILHRMDVSFDVEDSSDESQIFELRSVLRFYMWFSSPVAESSSTATNTTVHSYRILSSLVDTGLFPVLYDKVAL